MATSTGQYSSSVDFRIGQTPPDNLSKEMQAGLSEIYNAMQLVINTFIDKCGISQQLPILWQQLAQQDPGYTLNSGNDHRLYVQASEAIAFGAMVNLHNVAGVLQARNANATNNTKPAQGFCSTSGGIGINGYGEVQLTHGLVSISGLTAGSRYYLSTVNGLVSASAAVAAGNIEQYIGVAITTTLLYLNTHYWVQH